MLKSRCKNRECGKDELPYMRLFIHFSNICPTDRAKVYNKIFERNTDKSYVMLNKRQHFSTLHADFFFLFFVNVFGIPWKRFLVFEFGIQNWIECCINTNCGIFMGGYRSGGKNTGQKNYVAKMPSFISIKNVNDEIIMKQNDWICQLLF